MSNRTARRARFGYALRRGIATSALAAAALSSLAAAVALVWSGLVSRIFTGHAAAVVSPYVAGGWVAAVVGLLGGICSLIVAARALRPVEVAQAARPFVAARFDARSHGAAPEIGGGVESA